MLHLAYKEAMCHMSIIKNLLKNGKKLEQNVNDSNPAVIIANTICIM